MNFLAAPPPPFEPRKCRFRRDLTTSTFWVFKTSILPLFLGLLAQNGRIEQTSLKCNAVTKNAFGKSCERLVLFLALERPPVGGQEMCFKPLLSNAWFRITLCPNPAGLFPVTVRFIHNACVTECLLHTMTRHLCNQSHTRHPSKRIEEESKSPP